MGYFISKDLEFEFKRGIIHTDITSTIQFTSRILDRSLEKILEKSRLSKSRENEFIFKYRIIGTGNNLRNARGNFYLKLYEIHRRLKKRKKITVAEKEILKLYSKLISKKEIIPNSSEFY